MLPITPFPKVRSEDSHSRTKDRVAHFLAEGLTVTQIAAVLHVSKSTVCFHKRTLGGQMDERFARRYDWAEIRSYYEAGHSMRECRARFGFSAWAWSEAVAKGRVVPRPRAAPLDDVLVRGRKTNRWHLKRRLVREGLKEDVCENCGISEWRGRPLALELHHVNGDGLDNRLENLAITCPNCHSQTENWGARNIRRRAA